MNLLRTYITGSRFVDKLGLQPECVPNRLSAVPRQMLNVNHVEHMVRSALS